MNNDFLDIDDCDDLLDLKSIRLDDYIDELCEYYLMGKEEGY